MARVALGQTPLYLLRKESLLHASIDISNFVEEAFATVLSHSSDDKIIAYEIITKYLDQSKEFFKVSPNASGESSGTNVSSQTLQKHEKRCISLLDKLPILIPQTVGSYTHDQSLDNEMKVAIICCIRSLAQNSMGSILSHWASIMNKLVTSTLLKSYSKDPVYIVSVLHALLTASKVRGMLSPHVKAIRETMRDLVVSKSLFSANENQAFTTVSEVFALLASIETPDQWTQYFNSLVNDMIFTLGKLGISTQVSPLIPTSQSTNSKALNSSAHLIDWEQEFPLFTGATKAMYLNAVFERLNLILRQVLLIGCSTGFVTIDLAGVLALSQRVLTYHADASLDTNDAAAFIENEAGLSKVDIALVSSKLKLAMLQTMRTLVQRNFPTLIRFGTSIFQPITTLLGRKETKVVPALFDECLKCIQAVAEVIPGTVGNAVVSGGLNVLFDAIKLQVKLITSNRSIISHIELSESVEILSSLGKRKAYDGDEDIETENDEVAALVFKTLEKVILCSGCYFAFSPIRAQIELAVKQCLICLEKGLLPSQFQDSRKMHRMFGERLRHSSTLQQSVLSLAMAEVLSMSTSGLLSGNLSLLRSVCASVLHVATKFDEEVIATASKYLIMINHIMYPSTLTLPSQQVKDLGTKYLIKLNTIPEAPPATLISSSSNAIQSKELTTTAPGAFKPSATSSASDSTKIELETIKSPKISSGLWKSSLQTTQQNSERSTDKQIAISSSAAADDSNDDIPDIDSSSDIEA